MAKSFRDLPEEKDLSENLYQISKDEYGGHILIRNKTELQCKKEYPLDFSAQGGWLETLVSNLVTVANRRTREFDPLFNALDALDAICEYLTTQFPGLLASGVLQPLTDLSAAVQNRIVGRMPGLFFNRAEDLDGSYRWNDSYQIARITHPELFEDGNRPRRTYADNLEALITVALDGLMVGHEEDEALSLMDSLLETNGIRNNDDKPDQPITARKVRVWQRFVQYESQKGSAGRAHAWRKASKAFANQLAGCHDKAEGVRFATMLLKSVRCRQMTNYPKSAISSVNANRAEKSCTE